MQKIIGLILIFSILIIPFSLKANENISINAVVGNINSAPRILNINPSSNPRLLEVGETQTFIIKITDKELDNIYYTITAQDGYTNPISGIINSSDYNNQNEAFINFLYLSPANEPISNESKITITINDGPNVITKDINLYIYQ